MRVVIVGATGNTGTSLIRALADEPAVASILGLARRLPELELPKTEWERADITSDELAPHFHGADVVVQLAWLIQPSRREEATYATNVRGSARVFEAVAEAGVPSLVYASSIGAYSPGPKDRPVDESWETKGVGTSFYGRHKAAVEQILDGFEREHPETTGPARAREALTGVGATSR
ncbi:MAG TPA: NAD-dependent epimerase/dehydratase family protein [Gaiellaceae bacterium]|nr:NAD-dependent epimerase/dehydratase family protein [Gaiellaceae bacterium]